MEDIFVRALLGIPANMEIRPKPFESAEPAPAVEDDSILNLLFAADPVTGFPSSDPTAGLQNITNPEVANYVREKLQSPVTGMTSSGDADVDMALAYHRGESRDEYIARLSDYFDAAKSDAERDAWIKEHTKDKVNTDDPNLS